MGKMKPNLKDLETILQYSNTTIQDVKQWLKLHTEELQQLDSISTMPPKDVLIINGEAYIKVKAVLGENQQ